MNPFTKHTSTLFASRGCDIDEALQDAFDTIQRISEADRAHAMTALMVVVNTAANAFDQAQGPGPEKLAVQDMVRSMVSRQLDDWLACNLESAIDDWASNNLESKIEDQLDNLLDDKINDWMNDNLESKMEGEALCEAIRDAFRNNLSISIN